ncbi:MAG TPA: deoxyribodipyrimidine photolyase [Vicinamibacteria bacterium]|nr:deoxyribodipyrimidine photolyase [Vicinamibacteria bacterium]
MGYNQARLRRLNQARISPAGDYVLYWAQIYRRLERNHALDYALRCADELVKPLVVYEGLRIDYPWASRRLHRFVVDGMAANSDRAAALGLNYWPFVEREKGEGRGLLRRLSARAALVVTDDYPCFIVPAQAQALARRLEVPVFAVDSNSVVPLSLLGPAVSAAAHLRSRIHKAFAEAWRHRAAVKPRIPEVARRRVRAPFETWKPKDVAKWVDALPLDPAVPVVTQVPGGAPAARARLREFVKKRLRGYAAERSEPRSLAEGHASGLSAYLHFGHLSIEEVAEAVLATTGRWTPGKLRFHNGGERDGFFCDDEDVSSFLDEALTWRDVGFQWHWSRRRDAESLETALPPWALATLGAHAKDRRPRLYTVEELENGATHDPLWNAAQRELVATGTIHNYLRMLWGKKVLEWSASPAQAYRSLEHLNNKYALDGRDPNSYTGILWCFGLFDRPWAPERKVFGSVRYMSSENTARKFDLKPYYAYVESLPTIAEARAGRSA